MLLAGDIGGTKTDLAIYSRKNGPRQPLAQATLPSTAYAGLDVLVQDFLAQAVQLVSGKYRIKSRADGYCLYFQEGKGCGVHPARPDICRAWPFFRGNLIAAISWEMAQDFCPGIDPGVPHAEFARQGLAYLRKQGICRFSGPCDQAAAGPDGENSDKRREADTPEALVMNDSDTDAAAQSTGTARHAP